MKKIVGLMLLGLSSVALATEEQSDADFSQLEIEDLMNIQVTSANKKDQRLAEAPTAIFVLDQSKLKRSGATTVMDALRMVPGISDGRVSSHSWAISSRGFNGRLANKLLVLIDGRSVYSPLFSGVNWQVQDLVLEDIDRIEIIRGPGATIWGANAVNGVINIITKKADQTQGSLVSGLAGKFDRDQFAYRYGGKLGEQTYYRAYVKHAEWDNTPAPPNSAATLDDWNLQHAGLRIDSHLNEQQTLTVHADTLHVNYGDNFFVSNARPVFNGYVPMDGDTRSSNLLVHWDNQTTPVSKTSAQFYLADYQDDPKEIGEKRRTYDLEVQQQCSLITNHDMVTGFGIRRNEDKTQPGLGGAVIFPADKNYGIYHVFIQDEIALQDTLKMTLGTKFEHSNFTGWESLPNLRMSWFPNEQETYWGAVSKAIRTPNRIDSGAETLVEVDRPGEGFNPAQNPFNLGIVVSSAPELVQNEVIHAYELGYRKQFSENLSLDATTFYQKYFNGVTREMLPPVCDPSGNTVPFCDPNDIVRLEFVTGHNLEGHSTGFEVASEWHNDKGWTVDLSYSYMNALFHYTHNSTDMTRKKAEEDSSPMHQVSLLASKEWSSWRLDAWIRHAGSMPTFDVPSYTQLDLQLSKMLQPHLNIALVGKNLADSRTKEYVETFLPSANTEIPRSFYAKLSWEF